MANLIPAVSSHVAGPLGIAHLPRMWLKATLHATGSLADGYNSGGGMDTWLTDDLAIESEALFGFLKTLPTYGETEAWVRAHAGTIDEASIAAHNDRIRTSPLVMHNDLDDWAGLHAFLAARRGTKIEPLVPLVSMHSAGPLRIKHLPRMWVKARLHGAGALPDSWRTGETRVVYTNGVPGTLATPGQGIDAIATANLGIDMQAMVQYLHDERPAYPEFEHWIRANARKLDAASVAAHNAGAGRAEGERPAAELARMGYPEMTSCEMFTYNDLGDWDAIRTQMVAQRAAHAP